MAQTGRVGRGPSVGYVYSPGLWQIHTASSAHLLNCSLTLAQARIVSLIIARHWNSAYPLERTGYDRAVIEAINAGEQPKDASSYLKR